MSVGDMSKSIVYRTPEGKDAVRILYFKSMVRPHLANLKQDYQKIYNAALNQKRARIISEWFEEAKDDVFIDIDPEFRRCRILNIKQ